MHINPETPNLGAVVEGVDGKHTLSQSYVDELMDALMRYKVLFFRGLNLSREEHLEFSTQFENAYVNPSGFISEYDDEGVANVTVVPNFHADAMYLPQGPSFSMLRMAEMPAVGGDTMWADLVSSYRDLSERFKEFLESLIVLQASDAFYLSDEIFALDYKMRHRQNLTSDQISELKAGLAPWECPLVRYIPETGLKNYWVAPRITRAIKGLTAEESQTILGALFEHQLQPQYIYRWKWTVGDIAFWDHRTTLHCGISDFGAAKRRGSRVSIGVNSPISAPEI